MSSTETPVSEVLNRAADLIELHGWTRGSSGWDRDSENGPLCLEGGILAALGRKYVAGDMAEWQACPAYQAVHAYLDLPSRRDDLGHYAPRGRLWFWNDTNSRDAEEVIATLRAAAIVELARESGVAPLPVGPVSA